jgi:hypothetical protein
MSELHFEKRSRLQKIVELDLDRTLSNSSKSGC